MTGDGSRARTRTLPVRKDAVVILPALPTPRLPRRPPAPPATPSLLVGRNPFRGSNKGIPHNFLVSFSQVPPLLGHRRHDPGERYRSPLLPSQSILHPRRFVVHSRLPAFDDVRRHQFRQTVQPEMRLLRLPMSEHPRLHTLRARPDNLLRIRMWPGILQTPLRYPAISYLPEELRACPHISPPLLL